MYFSNKFCLFYHGGKGVTSGFLAVVFSAALLVDVLMISVAGRSRPRFAHLLVAGVGLSGVVCLFWQQLQLTETASTSWGMFYGACYLALFSLISHHEFIVEPAAKYMLGLVWPVLSSSLMTFAIYLSLVGRIGASRARYATVIFPVFALLISTMCESYPLSGLAYLGLGLVICGNVIIVRARAE